MNLKQIGCYLAERGKEASTWRGLVWIGTALGIGVSPEWIEQITVVGMTVAGILGTICKQ